jgi:protein-S-isoprenylcysteine O-methyltransferase Ste14
MFAEERFLQNKFGKDYINWASTKPAFIPRFSNYVKSQVPFSFKSVLRREYSGVLATVIGFVFVEIVRNYFTRDCLYISNDFLIVLLVAFVVSIVLRTIKKTTTFLQEEGRF